MGTVVRTFKPSVGEGKLQAWFSAKQVKARLKDPDFMVQGDVHCCGGLTVLHSREPFDSELEALRGTAPWRGEAIAVRYRSESSGFVRDPATRVIKRAKGPIRWLVVAKCPN